jgi:Ca2+-transporting ATPase
VDGLAKALGSDVNNGIQETELSGRKLAFGENKFATPPLATYCDLFLATFEDPVLLILCFAVVIALIVGLLEDPAHGWHESVAIFISILIVSNVQAGSDYRKQLQFEQLFKKGEVQECTVVRLGDVKQVDKADLLVGDVVKLKTGDRVPADGVICPGTADNLQLNEVRP